MTTSSKFRMVFLAAALICTVLAVSSGSHSVVFAQEDCIEDGGIDDTGYRTDCCSGRAVPGSTYCLDPEGPSRGDYSSCTQICGSSVE